MARFLKLPVRHRLCNVTFRMNPKAEALKARTRTFAIDVIQLVKTFPHATDGEIVGKQLMRAASGVAANYRAACRARSHPEFVARIGVVLEEADESEFWIGVAWEVERSRTPEMTRLHEESRQFVAIFSAANITARRVTTS